MKIFYSNRLNYHELLDKLDKTDSQFHHLTLALILLIGLMLRLYAYFMGQGYHYFAINDEISAYNVALGFLAGDKQALYIGQPIFSGGHAPGPAWTLFWVMLYKLGGDTITGACLVMTLINSALAWLIYRFALKFLSPKYALLSTFVFATAPWAIYYAFGVWNPMPMALWGALLFLSLWNVTQQNQSRQIFWVCLLTAVIPQFHMIGVFYMPVIALILYLCPTSINKKWLAIGLIAGFCVYIPYIIGESTTHWENTRAIFSESIPRSYGVLKILNTPINVLSNFPGDWAGDTVNEFKHFADIYFGSYIVFIILSLISIILSLIFFSRLIANFVRSMQGHWFTGRQAFTKSPKIMFIGLLLTVPSILFMVTGHNYGSRYAIIAFPLLFLLPALYLQRLNPGKKRSIMVNSFGVVIAVNVYLIIAFFHYQHNQITGNDVFLASFHNLEDIRQQLLQDAGKQNKIIIDVEKYIKHKPEVYYVNGIALSHYMQSSEKYLRKDIPDSHLVEYTALTAKDPVAGGKVIVYQDHGLVLIRKKNK